MLRWNKRKGDIAFFRDTVFLPPVEFDDILTSRSLEPGEKSLWYKPAQIHSESRVQQRHGVHVQVIIVIVGDEDGVQFGGEIMDRTARITITFRADHL